MFPPAPPHQFLSSYNDMAKEKKNWEGKTELKSDLDGATDELNSFPQSFHIP
jgi:hypothetical protein